VSGGDLIDRLLDPARTPAPVPPPAPASGDGGPLLPGHLEVRGVRRTFEAERGTRLLVLDGVDLEVRGGEIVSLIGPNGSGKSTLLRIAAGLLAPDVGEVALDGSPLGGPDPRIGLVFQEPRLLPWRTVAENVAYPLELAGRPAPEREERVMELLDLVGLDAAAHVVPSRLSGGMRQRAALARGLALAPEVLLLDEPFSALDALTRERFNVELLKLWSRMRRSIVFVTHSIQEALFIADRVVVLSSRPARVVADFEVPFDRPRRPAMLDEPPAGALAGRIRAALGPMPSDPPLNPAGAA
jgi:NitT/TauT family transport system ATP-binding protein